MEINIVSENCLRIKGKRAALIVDPTKHLRTKVAGDGVLIFNAVSDHDEAKVEEQRLVIIGPGEYEIGGIKISGSKNAGSLMYQIGIDGLTIMLTNASSIEKAKEKLGGYDILLLHCDVMLDLAIVATLEPRVIVLYGEHAQKIQSADVSAKVAKFSATKDKLPEKMEVVVLQ